ncbi:MAG: biopolymer transporter ExbD [Cyanobacteria bacterium J06635_15]
MKLDLDSGNEDIRIEILPLIDVIFCILTFFILAAVGLTRQQAISLDLPSASTGAPIPGQGLTETGSEKLYVSLDDRGQVYIDQQPVSLNLLFDVLIQHQQTSPNGLIVLNAARDARYADVIQVLDLLRSVGGDRVALATLPAGLDQLQQPDGNDQQNLDDLNNDLNDLLNGSPSPFPGETNPAPTAPLPSNDDLFSPETGLDNPDANPNPPDSGGEAPQDN